MYYHNKNIERLIRQLGATGNYKGFQYLLHGITLSIDNPGLLTYIYKGLYVDVAKDFRTTVGCVERDLRTIKCIMWQYGDKELLRKIFGDAALNPKPVSNAEFIDGLVAYIKEINLSEH